MSPENNQKLVEAYPKIFSSIRYCGVGDGWFDIINNLCQLIQEECDANPEIPQVVAAQIKEKFGSLRFYYDGGNLLIDQLVEKAEGTSTRTCEVCGVPGEQRTGGWIKTLCDHHAK